jgi:hypothetical protein
MEFQSDTDFSAPPVHTSSGNEARRNDQSEMENTPHAFDKNTKNVRKKQRPKTPPGVFLAHPNKLR